MNFPEVLGCRDNQIVKIGDTCGQLLHLFLSALIRRWPGSEVLKWHVLQCCFKAIYHRDQGCEEAPAIICYSSFHPEKDELLSLLRNSLVADSRKSSASDFFLFFPFRTTGFLDSRNARNPLKVIIRMV